MATVDFQVIDKSKPVVVHPWDGGPQVFATWSKAVAFIKSHLAQWMQPGDRLAWFNGQGCVEVVVLNAEGIECDSRVHLTGA